MRDINFIIWLLPILFIFHDFEEIIMMKPWVKRNKRYLSKKYPKLSNRLLPHFENISTSSFAFGVAEEFVIISIITILAYYFQWFYMWSGLFIVFTLHLLMHCIQAVIIRRYVPVVITSILCLPISIYICMFIVDKFSFNKIMIFTLINAVMIVVNILAMHKTMDVISKLLTKYENESTHG